MEIKIATLDDLEFLESLEEESFPKHRRSTRNSLRNSITSPFQIVFIALQDNKNCGALFLMPYKKHVRIYSIAVSKEFGRAGIGTQLINHAIKFTKDSGLNSISLEVDIHNSNLIRWYENFGFEAVQVIVDYYAKDEDALKMMLRLDVEEKVRNIVVIDYKTDFFDNIPGIIKIRAIEYIENEEFQSAKNIRVFNLCSSLNYQSVGYYVSLLALARNHYVQPNTTTLRDFKNNTIIKSIGDEIFTQMQNELKNETCSDLTLDSYFGYSFKPEYQNLIKALNLLYEVPLIRYHFVKKDFWSLQRVSTVDLNTISNRERITEYAIEYFSQRRFSIGSLNRYKYDMAILVDDKEPNPPSCKTALNIFKIIAESLGFFVEFITKKDYKRIPEFDALFIRVTTNVNDYTYDFSRYAYAEGLIVIDDPWSILKCSNKLYLFEALRAAGIKTPRTWTISKKVNNRNIMPDMTYPVVLKQPDSAFSIGVYKVTNPEDLQSKLTELFKKSEIIIAQEFIPSEYDWRIGVLDKQPIFACKYYMAKDHWQIYNWDTKDADDSTGNADSIPLAHVPKKVLKAALKAANTIGDGLYGVDLKEVNGEIYVIEVNDNPSIDFGVEDQDLGDKLYLNIMKSFYFRLENARVSIRKISQ